MLAVDLSSADGMVGGVEGTSCILEHYSQCALNPKIRKAHNRAPQTSGRMQETSLSSHSTSLPPRPS